MALPATLVWEVRHGGSDTNGGGFVLNGTGTDWSQQDSPQYSVTDGVTAGTTTITSATAAFGTDVVDNIAYIQAGTGSVVGAWYRIVSRTNATTIVVDRSTGLTAGTGVTLHIGGALASPAVAASAKVGGNNIFIKYNASPYVISSTTANVSGGVVSDSVGGTGVTNFVFWAGYDTTRTVTNTDANRPTLQVAPSGVTSVTVMNFTNAEMSCRNIIVDGNSATGITGFAFTTNYQSVIRCTAMNTTVKGFSMTTVQIMQNCSATGCSGTCAIGVGGGTVTDSIAYANSTHGFQVSSYPTIVNSISANNTGSTSNGFDSTSVGYRAISCIAVGNGQWGFSLVGNTGLNSMIENCVAYDNVGEDYHGNQAEQGAIIINCAGRAAGTGYTATFLPIIQGYVTLTANPWVSSSTLNFTPNALAGGGALLKAAAAPKQWLAASFTSYADIGGVQHQDSSAAATVAYTSS